MIRLSFQGIGALSAPKPLIFRAESQTLVKSVTDHSSTLCYPSLRSVHQKGPYYADVGNYGSAGSANLVFFKTLPQNFIQVEGGMYGYGRAVFGISQKVGSGSLLFGGECYYDDGPWTHPDAYKKFNGLLTYSHGGDANGFSIMARGYNGK